MDRTKSSGISVFFASAHLELSLLPLTPILTIIIYFVITTVIFPPSVQSL